MKQNYIIPKDIRELRLQETCKSPMPNYIIPKDIRELRRINDWLAALTDYIIPKDIRELRPVRFYKLHPQIISYQKI